MTRDYAAIPHPNKEALMLHALDCPKVAEAREREDMVLTMLKCEREPDDGWERCDCLTLSKPPQSC